jgi:hypothetical protein
MARDKGRMTGMFYHVVLMRLIDADDAFLAWVSDYGEWVRRELPYVRDYHFGRNAALRAKGYGWTVIGTFENSADHDRYQASPVHQEMKAFMMPHIADIVVCDFGATGDG